MIKSILSTTESKKLKCAHGIRWKPGIFRWLTTPRLPYLPHLWHRKYSNINSYSSELFISSVQTDYVQKRIYMDKICFHPIGHFNNTPTMQYFTGISKNTQSKSHTLSLTERIWEFQNNALWDTH